MRILICTLGLAAMASTATANPPVKPVQAHGNPHTTTTPAKPAPTPTPPPPLNPIAAKITAHPQLAAKLTPMLPKGITLDRASQGFKNQGQFIAALHVSQNLGVSFMDVKNAMVTTQKTPTGTTMTQTGSLGQAIQKVKGTPNTTAVTTAEHQADDDLKTTTTTTTTSSTTGSKPKPKTTQNSQGNQDRQ
jgi:hypothetical protein